MMDDGESRKEASIRMMPDLLRPKQRFLIGAWNVRTLYQTGKLAQTISEVQKYDIDMLAVSEARWNHQGLKHLASGHDILYSGRSDDHHSNGVALILAPQIRGSLLEWTPLGERLLKARFSSKFTKLTVIVCYAPQEDKSDEEKDAFYDTLSSTIQMTPTHDMLLVLGDLNAKVGKDNQNQGNVMGPHGMGDRNENGTRLIELCEEHNMVIGGTLFQHKEIHKYTWTSPDGRTRNQIDHILINKKWKSSLQNVRTKRGADIGSDHNLVVANVKLKLRKTKKGAIRKPKFDLERLRKEPQVAKNFQIEIRNRFAALQDETDLSIQSFNQELIESSKATIGHRRKPKEQWISGDSWEKIEQRKTIKKRLLQTKSPRMHDKLKEEYSNMDKAVKKATRNDKRNYHEKLAEESEKAALQGDMKTLYKTTKLLTGGFKNSDVPIKNMRGETIANEEEKINRWKEHFENILNREPPRLRPTIHSAEQDLPINVEPPTENEVRKAIQSLKNGKAAGEDEVTAEMLKIETEFTPKLLQKIFHRIWESENLPEEWKTGLIVKLPKKGDLTDCGNWRGIMLLSVTSKVFSRIVLNRMNTEVDKLLRKQQAGFRKGRSCADHIFTLRQIFEQSKEWNTALYANFIDFEKAFDSVHRPALWKILRHYGIPEKVVNIIKMLYQEFNAKVICGQELSGTFKINTGVKQGCILSPFLFCLAIDWVMKESLEGNKTGIQWTFNETLEDLDFADDVVLLSQRFKDMQIKTNTIYTQAQKIGLKMNMAKTKTMRLNSKESSLIKLGDRELEDVMEFSYLGSSISSNGNSEDDVNQRLKKARQAFGALRNIWKSGKISKRTKTRIYKTNVLPVLLYGSESWKITKTIAKKLEAFQNKCLRRILRIFWPNRTTNAEIRCSTGIQPVSEIIDHRRWRWIGHVTRMESNSITKTALRWTPAGHRKKGRPMETWRRRVEKDMKDMGLSWGRVEKLAANREEWRSLLPALCVKLAR